MYQLPQAIQGFYTGQGHTLLHLLPLQNIIYMYVMWLM
jgi:hypothetical protein